MSSSSDFAPLLIAQLRTEFNGRVIAPDDAGYDEVQAVFIGGDDRQPGRAIESL